MLLCSAKQRGLKLCTCRVEGREGRPLSSHSAKQDPRGLRREMQSISRKKWVAVAKSAVKSAVAPSPSENTGTGKQNNPSGKTR